MFVYFSFIYFLKYKIKLELSGNFLGFNYSRLKFKRKLTWVRFLNYQYFNLHFLFIYLFFIQSSIYWYIYITTKLSVSVLLKKSNSRLKRNKLLSLFIYLFFFINLNLYINNYKSSRILEPPPPYVEKNKPRLCRKVHLLHVRSI